MDWRQESKFKKKHVKSFDCNSERVCVKGQLLKRLEEKKTSYLAGNNILFEIPLC